MQPPPGLVSIAAIYESLLLQSIHVSIPMDKFVRALLILAITGIYGCHSYPVFTSGSIETTSKNVSLKIGFSDYDRRRIYQYYNSGERKKLPPGIAKKRQLPPGLQKQIRERGRLPPGLERQPLPHDLERNLSPVPEGHIRFRVGTDIVLMDGRTRLLVDVIKDLAF